MASDESFITEAMTEVKSPFPMAGLDPIKMKVMGVNVFPAMIKFISMLPDKARKEMSTKQVGSSQSPN